MPSGEQLWTAVLAAGVLTVGCVALFPALVPRPQAPTVTRTELSPIGPLPTTEPPVFPTTASVVPLISGRLNLNTATREQLEALPRIGPKMAQRIIEGRPYRSLADLDRVRGIGEAALRSLTPLVSF